MIFSEVYSAYFLAVSRLIEKAMKGELNEKEAIEMIRTTAFSESVLTILPAIKQEQWQVITKDFRTPIKNKPEMPLTLLEKRWLKAVLMDRRIRLFYDGIQELEGIEPLYTEQDFYFFDIKKDGDSYEEEAYIRNFKTILSAIKEKRRLLITNQSKGKRAVKSRYYPYKLEYSHKDDKFRLLAVGTNGHAVINLSNIVECEKLACK